MKKCLAKPRRDRKHRRGKLSRICKHVHRTKKIPPKSHLNVLQKRSNITVTFEPKQTAVPNVAEKSPKIATKVFDVDYTKTIRSITTETSRNQTSQEQYYGKRITFIVLLSTASTILLFAIMFAICKRSCWSRMNKFRKPLHEQTSETETSFRQCRCIDEDDEIYTSEGAKCLRCWRKNRECRGGSERTPLISARRKRKRRKRRRKEPRNDAQSSDESLKEPPLATRRQSHTRIPQRNSLFGKINQCVYRKNDPDCQCWKCREYVAMFHLWSSGANRPFRRQFQEPYSSDLDRLASYGDTEDSSESAVFKSCPCARKSCQLKHSLAGEKVCVHEMTDKK